MIFYALFAFVRNFFRLLLAPLILLRRSRACPEGATIHLVIDGGVVEMHRPRPRLPWVPKPTSIALDQVHALIDALIDDPRPAGLLVTIKHIAAAPAYRTALRNELLRLRKAGKSVVVHLPFGGSTPELLIASAATRVLMGAHTNLGPLGFRSGSFYFRHVLDRVGIEPDVHAQGAYKTAGESAVRDSMSEAQREQLGRLLDLFQEELVSALATGRGVSQEQAKRWIDQGLFQADHALQAGLVHAVVHDDEVPHLLTEARAEKPATLVRADRYLQRHKARVFRPWLPKPRIAVIELHGPIVESSPVRMGPITEMERTMEMLHLAEEHPRVCAVVLHIDSPGGGVLASEKIYRAVHKLAQKKPVIACFGGVSASGGYYVGVAAHMIIAQPTTITGSIGVVAARPIVAPLLARVGITPQVLTRGAFADMMNITRPFREEEKELFSSQLEASYKHFISIVATSRKRTPDDILPLAGGRVWAGVDALSHGLVDRIGSLEVAIEEARKKAAAVGENAEPVLLAPPASRWPSPMLPFLPSSTLEAWGAKPLASLAQLMLGTREKVLAFFDPEILFISDLESRLRDGSRYHPRPGASHARRRSPA